MSDRTPFKKKFSEPEIHFEGKGERRVGFTEEDLTSEHFHVLNHGTVKPGFRLPWFLHEDKDEVIVVLEGTAAVHFKEHHPIQLEVGETIYIPAGVEHSVENTGESDFKGIFFKVFT